MKALEISHTKMMGQKSVQNMQPLVNRVGVVQEFRRVLILPSHPSETAREVEEERITEIGYYNEGKKAAPRLGEAGYCNNNHIKHNLLCIEVTVFQVGFLRNLFVNMAYS